MIKRLLKLFKRLVNHWLDDEPLERAIELPGENLCVACGHVEGRHGRYPSSTQIVGEFWAHWDAADAAFAEPETP